MGNNAALYDPTLLIAAGIDPYSVLPKNKIKPLRAEDCSSKSSIKKALRIIDEQTAVNRFTWYNLPDGLNSKLIERVLYYKGQGIFFKLKNKFYFLPYALSGSIDVYGRFTQVTPLPFNGTANNGKPDQPWISGLDFKPVYDAIIETDLVDENGQLKSKEELEYMLDSSCVILKDYTEQMSQTNISRQILNDSLLDLMSDCFPFMRTALLNATGVKGMRVGNQNESTNVWAANAAMEHAALTGQPNIPIVGTVDFQEMTSGQVGKAEEFLLAMQSLDNFRLSTYGLDNGGLFQKKSHMLQAEQEMNTGNVGLIMKDSLDYRQEACTIFNSIFGTSMWCEPSEVVLGMDTDGDGIAGDNEAGNKEMLQQEAMEENV